MYSKHKNKLQTLVVDYVLWLLFPFFSNSISIPQPNRKYFSHEKYPHFPSEVPVVWVYKCIQFRERMCTSFPWSCHFLRNRKSSLGCSYSPINLYSDIAGESKHPDNLQQKKKFPLQFTPSYLTLSGYSPRRKKNWHQHGNKRCDKGATNEHGCTSTQ